MLNQKGFERNTCYYPQEYPQKADENRVSDKSTCVKKDLIIMQNKRKMNRNRIQDNFHIDKLQRKKGQTFKSLNVNYS